MDCLYKFFAYQFLNPTNMKKLLLFLFVFMLSAAALFAQAPQKMSYQAVVRNANNALV